MRIVAFDPGERTGFCEALVSDDGSFQVVMSCTIAWRDRFIETPILLQSNETVPLPEIIVVESFRLYAHKAKDQIGNDFPSAQMIGTIQTYLHQLGILDRLILQPASAMSRVQILPDHMPSLDRAEHARDAYKHLRYYIVTHLI